MSVGPLTILKRSFKIDADKMSHTLLFDNIFLHSANNLCDIFGHMQKDFEAI